MLKIKINKSSFSFPGTFISFAVFIMLMFAYSRLSWGIFIPSLIWGAGLALSVCLFILAHLMNNSFRISKDVNIFFFAIMVAVIIVNHNHDISANGFFNTAFPYICMFIMYTVCSQNGGWSKLVATIMVVMGLFFSILTIICVINESFYYSVVYPTFTSYKTTYTANPAAGFTAHYSTNAIYLAMGLCAILGKSYFQHDGKFVEFNLPEWLSLIISFIAILMCGKRGLLLFLVAAVFLAFRNYEIVNKQRRIVKTVGIVIVVSVFLFLASNFFPNVKFIIDRLSLTIETGDGLRNRFLYWSYAWSSFLQKPIFGWGWRWFKNRNTIPKVDVHNCYLQLFTENGILGATFFLLFFIVALKRANQLSINVRKGVVQLSNNEVALIYIALMNEIFILLYMFGDTPLYMPESMFTYFISCAIVEYYRKQARKHKIIIRQNFV